MKVCYVVIESNSNEPEMSDYMFTTDELATEWAEKYKAQIEKNFPGFWEDEDCQYRVFHISILDKMPDFPREQKCPGCCCKEVCEGVCDVVLEEAAQELMDELSKS